MTERYIPVELAAKEFGISAKELHKLLYDKEKLLEISLLQFDTDCTYYGGLVMSRYLFEDAVRLINHYTDKMTPLDVIKEKRGTSLPLAKDYYVYFLFEKGLLVYIGQTVNLNGRIGEHIKTKVFDEVYHEKHTQFDLSIMEAVYINKYGTSYNIVRYDHTLLIKKIIEKIDLFDTYG